MIVNCLECDKKFNISPSRSKNKTVCCSVICASKYKKKTYTKNIRLCSICNNSFKRKTCHTNRIKHFLTCSRKCAGIAKSILYLGRKNPNCIHQNLPDNFFKKINTEEKAYILGWIASDGNISTNYTITISIHQKDQEILEKIKKCLCESLNLKLRIKNNHSPMVDLCLNSKEMCLDVCKHLKIDIGKKAYKMRIPDLDGKMMWHFLRGYFDGDGSITKVQNKSLSCSIASVCNPIKKRIKSFCQIPCSINEDSVVWSTNSAMEFLNKLYQNSSIQLDRKYQIYKEWKNMYDKGFKTLNQMNKHILSKSIK